MDEADALLSLPPSSCTGSGGKSLYASRQLGADVDTNLFELGHYQDGKTRGLWCAFVEQSDSLLCVIDSEGLADALKSDRVCVNLLTY